jgi:hypothetical protein
MCKADLAQFCSTVQPGAGRLIVCLTTHRTALHPDCRERVDAINAIEADLAARAHEPVDQFLAEAYARRAHGEYVKKLNAQKKQSAVSSSTTAPAPVAGTAQSGQTPPPPKPQQ